LKIFGLGSLQEELEEDNSDDAAANFENLSLEYKFKVSEGNDIEELCLNNSKVA
jgi:hypothetical protein